MKPILENWRGFLKEDKRVVTAYHGSNVEIKNFSRDHGAQGVMWFSEDRDKIIRGESGALSSKYIMKVELNVDRTTGWQDYDKKYLKQIEDEGYDSIQLDDDWIVFDPARVKVVGIENRDNLKEAKFENEATKMVRDVVNNIKKHLRAYDGEPRIKPRFGELEHPLESIVYDKKSFGGLPDTLAAQGINKVTFSLKVEPSTAFGEGKKFGVDGKTFTYDDDFGKGEIVKDRQVRVNVYLSDEFTMKDMSSLIEKMKDTAVHEITHGGQPTDVLRKSGQAQMKAFQHGLTSLEALRLYYLEPAETEAYARGVYKRAKMSKAPFTTKLDEQIKELLGFYAHPKTLEKSDTQYTEEEVNNFFKKEYRQSIIDYAKETLPAAVIGAEEFNN